MSDRFMVCKACLNEHGGAEKSCGHGWDILRGKPRSGTCSHCGKPTETLHCPDGWSRQKGTVGPPVPLAPGETRGPATIMATMHDAETVTSKLAADVKAPRYV